MMLLLVARILRMNIGRDLGGQEMAPDRYVVGVVPRDATRNTQSVARTRTPCSQKLGFCCYPALGPPVALLYASE